MGRNGLDEGDRPAQWGVDTDVVRVTRDRDDACASGEAGENAYCRIAVVREVEDDETDVSGFGHQVDAAILMRKSIWNRGTDVTVR